MFIKVQAHFIKSQPKIIKCLFIKPNYFINSLANANYNRFTSYSTYKWIGLHQNVFQKGISNACSSSQLSRKMCASHSLNLSYYINPVQNTLSLDDIQMNDANLPKCNGPSCFNEKLNIKSFHSIVYNKMKVDFQDNNKNILNSKYKELFHITYSNADKNSSHYFHSSHPHQSNKGEMTEPRKATEEHLIHVEKILTRDLTDIFSSRKTDPEIYSPNIIFENRIRGTTSIGLAAYLNQIRLLHFIGYIRYAQVKFEILKITLHTDDGTVRVRWRIVGLSSIKYVIKTFRVIMDYKKKETKKQSKNWHDGFSIFYVGKDGLIHKHIADKVIPDNVTNPGKVPLMTRLTENIGLIPKTSSHSSSTNMK